MFVSYLFDVSHIVPCPPVFQSSSNGVTLGTPNKATITILSNDNAFGIIAFNSVRELKCSLFVLLITVSSCKCSAAVSVPDVCIVSWHGSNCTGTEDKSKQTWQLFFPLFFIFSSYCADAMLDEVSSSSECFWRQSSKQLEWIRNSRKQPQNHESGSVRLCWQSHRNLELIWNWRNLDCVNCKSFWVIF